MTFVHFAIAAQLGNQSHWSHFFFAVLHEVKDKLSSRTPTGAGLDNRFYKAAALGSKAFAPFFGKVFNFRYAGISPLRYIKKRLSPLLFFLRELADCGFKISVNHRGKKLEFW